MKRKLVAVAVAALAPVVAMLAYGEVATRHQRNEEIRAQAVQAARQASSEVDRIIEGLRSLLIAVTAMPVVQKPDAVACTPLLESVAKRVPNIGMIFVLDREGDVVCGSSLRAASANFADRDYFQEAIQKKDFVVGNFTKSRMSGAAVLPVAMPLMNGDDVAGVVVTGIRLDWLQTRIAERGVSPGNAVTLADGTGTILARVPFPNRFVGTRIPETYLSLVHAEKPDVIDVMSQDGTKRILAYRPISLPNNPVYVSAGLSREEAFGPINRSTLINTFAIIMGALFSFLVALYIGHRFLLLPVARISNVLERWRSGETTARTQMAGPDELSSVGASLDQLLDELECRRRRNEEAEEERALLIKELAHRVKNGFALVQAIARQTLSRVDREGYQAFADRLTALAGSYDLILTKETSAASIRLVIENTLRALMEPGSVRVRLKGPGLALPAEFALPLSLVIHELATNATKYGSLGGDGGKVTITWEAEGSDVHLRWSEQGGPTVAAPVKKGFGSTLIERAFPAKALASCTSDFQPTGLVFDLTFSIAGEGQSFR